MIREQNLIPAKKGEVRNPKGKAKGTRNRKTIIRQWLEYERMTENPLTAKRELLSVAQCIVLEQVKAALDGNLRACEWLFDCAFGKMTDKNEMKIDADVTATANTPLTRAEIRELVKQKGINPDELFRKG